MARTSTKENKKLFQLRREELGLSREAASELLGTITQDRLEKIENEIYEPYPEEILRMSEEYRMPELCNDYCANQCAIGKKYVPEVKVKDVSQIVIEMLDALNNVEEKRKLLISIVADGKLGQDEVKDFAHIQAELERMSMTIEALQLWSEQMMAEGKIDEEIYLSYKE